MANLQLLGQQARQASRALSKTTTEKKNAALIQVAERIWSARETILIANREDVNRGVKNGLTPALIDRLSLNEKRLDGIVQDLKSVANLPDPVGERFDEATLPNGLKMYKQRVPIGVLGVIYEARPNVTVDVFGLALKSGNCAILRGGSETIRSNVALAQEIRTGLSEAGLPENIVQLIDDPDRKLVGELLLLDEYVDLIIPRGGAVLHEFCRKNSRIPVITGGIGICHLYVDETADLNASVAVIENAKIQRPSVCNALDTVLVNERVAAQFLPMVVVKLSDDGVTFRADPEAYGMLSEYKETVFAAGEKDFDTEWLSLVLGLKVVNGLDEAMEHISQHSTAHSDGILTRDDANASRFVAEVDSAAVYVNASTRFTDGSQLGLGAEVAISTQKVHARGPMGLRELTSYKYVVMGNYHVRP